MPEIIVATEADIPLIHQIAETTWMTAYASIISKEQIRYMLDTIYSAAELKKGMNNKSQKFLLVKDKDGFQGFASFGARADEKGVFKLHKIYILPDNQGKGYGAFLVKEIKRELLAQGINILDLNVNRNNQALQFYKKLGFRIIREEDIPIGQFWMNDYVMRLEFNDC